MYRRQETNDVCNQALNDLGFSKHAVDERIRIRSIISEAMTIIGHHTFGDNIDKILVGSKRDGISLFGESDADVMFVLNNMSAAEEPAMVNQHVHEGQHVFTMEMDGVPTGYTLLRLTEGTEVSADIAGLLEGLITGKYLSSTKIMTGDPDKFKMRGGWREHAVSQSPRRGPSLPQTMQSDDWYTRLYDDITGNGDLTNNDTDKVQAIPCECPSLLQAWVTRPRPNNWPTKEMIGQFSQKPVHVVPVGRSGSVREDLEWRISFTMGEIYLIHQFNDTQLKVLVLIRIISKDILKPISRKFSSYLMKNIVLWLSENISQECFKAEHLLSRVLDGLHHLLRSIREKKLPCYTIPARNLLHSLQDDEASRAQEALEHFLVNYDRNVMEIITDIGKPSSHLNKLSHYDARCIRSYANISAERLVEFGMNSANCNTSFQQHWFNMRAIATKSADALGHFKHLLQRNITDRLLATEPRSSDMNVIYTSGNVEIQNVPRIFSENIHRILAIGTGVLLLSLLLK